MKHSLVLFVLLCGSPTALRAAQLSFASVFTDHAVLQRDVAVPVWGWGDADERVTVTFGGQTKAATADANGKWFVKLDPMAASSEGRELLVQSDVDSRKLKITDIVVGDVWLCSGQSNMRFQMNRVENAQKEIAAADNPAIRFFVAEEQFARQPKANVDGSWKAVSPATVADCSGVAYYFAEALQPRIGVPIGLLVSSIGGTRIETWMESATLGRLGVADRLIDKWKDVSPDELKSIVSAYQDFQHQRDHEHPQAVRAAKADGTSEPPAPKSPAMRGHDCPSALHNGMIAPLQPFAIRGVLWYQGESNVAGPAAYEKLQPALIADWRRVWGADLPFLYVQLAPHKLTHPSFREAQHRIWQTTPQTAMVVTTDVGNANDIHPTRKGPVGERLALAARALSYGERIEYSGPVFESANIANDRIMISFSHVGSGLEAKGGSLKGFTIAGTDAKFVSAQAAIEGETVVVTSEKIDKPIAVRYGWATVPEANLFNREGLPAAPFRSDSVSESTRARASK